MCPLNLKITYFHHSGENFNFEYVFEAIEIFGMASKIVKRKPLSVIKTCKSLLCNPLLILAKNRLTLSFYAFVQKSVLLQKYSCNKIAHLKVKNRKKIFRVIKICFVFGLFELNINLECVKIQPPDQAM